MGVFFHTDERMIDMKRFMTACMLLFILALAACGQEKDVDADEFIKHVKEGQDAVDNYAFEFSFSLSYDDDERDEFERTGQVDEKDNLARTLQDDEEGPIDNAYFDHDIYYLLTDEWVPLGDQYDEIGHESFGYQFFTDMLIDLEEQIDVVKKDGDFHFITEADEDAFAIYEDYVPFPYDVDDRSVTIEGVLDGKDYHLIDFNVSVEAELDDKVFLLQHDIHYSDLNETSVDIPDELKE